MMRKSQNQNRLAGEKSPYLLQHAGNPVDWYPWGEEAFGEARRRRIPVFLSIGYSTCHWCHVMAEESFEDEEVAEILNRSFIAIKVDREERPDIDSVYMSACQALTGSGGWPLTIIMTPEKKPFIAGTYFPKTGNYRTTGLMELLLFVEKIWQQERERLVEEAASVAAFLEKRQESGSREKKSEQDVLNSAKAWFKETYDSKWGGFGSAPKFPSAHNLLLLMSQGEACAEMAEKTLIQMYRGGIFDHIGGGFCRYATDDRWLVPHFEKMLYDNAMLSAAYIEAYAKGEDPMFLHVAKRIFQYVLRELTHSQGAFLCGQDADSDGGEGSYYLFAPGEIQRTLGETDGREFCERFDITSEGNFEGKSIPNLLKTQDYQTNENRERLGKIYEFRKNRMTLKTDDKILTSWNGLMIWAFARAARVTGRREFFKPASRAEAFVWENLHQGEGRLLARWRQGEAKYAGTLEDYAFLAMALLECFEAAGDEKYLEKAALIGERMLEQFLDEKDGGCFLYGKDSETLFVRPKDFYDGAMPSGNGAAAFVMRKMAALTGRPEWKDAWAKQKDFYLKNMEHPAAHTFFLWVLTQKEQAVLRGPACTPQGCFEN